MKLLLPVILIIISLGTFFVYTNPHYKDVLSYKDQIAQYDEALNNEMKLEQDRDALSNKYHSFPIEAQQKLAKLVPDNVDNIRLIIDIQKVAVANGVNVIAINFDSAQANDAKAADSRVAQKDYGVFDLEFSITGTYQNFMKFLKATESNLRILDIQSISFSSGENEID